MKPNLDKLPTQHSAIEGNAESKPAIRNPQSEIQVPTASSPQSAMAEPSFPPVQKSAIRTPQSDAESKSALRNSNSAIQEVLRFAVTGRPDFSEATIKVLEETAFKLSLQCSEPEEESNPNSKTGTPEMSPKDSGRASLPTSELALKALNQITVMLARYRNASVRERMAVIQEKKLQLRCDEFEWKKSVHASKPAASDKSQLKNPKSKIQEDDLGRLAKTLDDVERRACEKFNLPRNAPSTESSPNNQSSNHDSRSEHLLQGNKLVAGLGSQIDNQSPSSSVISVPSVVNNSPSTENSAPRFAEANVSSGEQIRGGVGNAIHAPTASSPHSAMVSPSVAKDSPSVEQSALRNPHSAMTGPYLQTEKNANSASAVSNGSLAPAREGSG